MATPLTKKDLYTFLEEKGEVVDIPSSLAWREETDVNVKAGIYEELVKLSSETLRKSRSIIDICSGHCPVECEMGSEMLGGKKVICLEANPVSIVSSVQRLSERNILSRIVVPDGEIEESDAPITFLFSEITKSRAAMDALLQGGADLSIFTFAGACARLASSETDRTARQKKLQQLTTDVIFEGLAAASLHTKKDGALIRAERIVIPSDEKVEKKAVRQMEEDLHKITSPFWVIESSKMLAHHGVINEAHIRMLSAQGINPARMHERVTTHTLRRNGKPFDATLLHSRKSDSMSNRL